MDKTFRCPQCRLPHLDCTCGMDLAPFPWPDLTGPEWDTIQTLLKTRSGGLCEARTPACLARPRGELRRLSDRDVSVHHRKPRGRGGTRDAATHSLAALILICGSGTTGCHGYIERNRAWAYACGWLVRHAAPGRPTAWTDPAQVPLTLASGWKVLLDPVAAVPPRKVGMDVVAPAPPAA